MLDKDIERPISGLHKFGPFVLDPSQRRLTKDGAPISLTVKSFDLLVLLVVNSGKLLTKDEILEKVWDGAETYESSLTAHVSMLRQALGETKDARYIETVPKKGYRFTEEVKSFSEVVQPISGRPVDLLSDMGYIKPRSFGDPLCHWPALEVQGNTSQWIVDQNITQTIRSADSSDDELRRYISTRGYASLGDAVASFLGLSKSNHTSFSSAVYTWAPILADVKEARWNPASTLTVTYEAHPAVKDQFWISAKVSLPQQSDQHELSISQPVKGPTEWQMEVETEVIADEDARVDASLVHQTLGIIATSAWFVRDLIPKSNMNPLWPLLQKFCSAEEFLRLLATPGAAQDSGNRPQRLFELRVSWFLGAFGFTTFVLGPHECLRDPGTRVERGSLDLIAFHDARRVLILGSCKTNAPKESDYDNLVNMQRLLIDDLEGVESFETYMVVFTAAAETRLYKELETSGSGLFPRVIPVFDAQRLKAGIEALQTNHVDWIFEQLTGTARVPKVSFGTLGF